METNTKNTKAILLRKIFGVSLIVLFLFLLFPQQANGHLTPGDNYDGRGKLYALNSKRQGQGKGGNDPCKDQKRVNEPVNAATGEFTADVTDLYISGHVPIQIIRTYRSQRQHYSSPFGSNWFFIYDFKLRKLKDGNLLATFPNGDEKVFAAEGGERYRPCCGDPSVIIENPDGTYFFRVEGGRTYIFNGEGDLVRFEETRGNFLYFSYEERKKALLGLFRYSTKIQTHGILAMRRRLKEIRDDWGRYVRFTYYDDDKRGGRVKTVTFMPGTEHAVTVTYDYDKEGNLISVTGPATPQHANGTTTLYTYSSGHAAPNLNHNLISITSPKEVAAGKEPYLVNKYDENDRVVEQKYGSGMTYFTFTEEGENRITTIKDRAGNVTVTTFNKKGNPLKEVLKGHTVEPGESKEYITTYLYDPQYGRLAKVIYPSGAVLQYSYDEQGNIIETRRKTKDGDDADEDIVSRYTYIEPFNMIKTYTDPIGHTTTYDYDFEEAKQGDLNGDGITNQHFGQLVRVTYPSPKPGKKAPIYLYRYDQKGRFISGTDPLGRIDRVEYYQKGLSSGRVKRHSKDIKGIGAASEFTYNAQGNIISITDPNGNTMRFEVDAQGHISRSISPKPFEYKVNYFYDENGNLSRIDIENRGADGKVDPQNPFITYAFEYNSLNFPVVEKVEVGKVAADIVVAAEKSSQDVLVTRFYYDADDRLHRVIRPGGDVEEYEYDERGLVMKHTLAPNTPGEAVTFYTYTVDGYLSTVKDANGHITKFTYDKAGRLHLITGPPGNFLERKYSPNGNLIGEKAYSAERKLLGRKEWEYDGLNRMIMEHIHFFDPGGHPLKDGPLTPDDGRVSRAFAYDNIGNLVQITNDNGNSYKFTYDGLNRLIQAIDPVGNGISYRYDKAGNLLKSEEKNIYMGSNNQSHITVTSFNEYDSLNRLVKTIDPLKHVTEYSYDSRDNLVSIEDANGNIVRMQYDGLDRVIKEERERRDYKEANKKYLVKSYRYAGREQVTAITDDNGHITTFLYNAWGLPEKITYPDGSSVSMAWDGESNLVEQIDPGGIRTQYTYYPNNLIQMAVTGDHAETFAYDGLGRLVSARIEEKGEKFSDLSWAYDSMNNPIFINQDGREVKRKFDGVGNRLELTYPDGVMVKRKISSFNRPLSITKGDKKVADFTYIGPSEILHRKFVNNTLLSREYDQVMDIIKNIHLFNNKPFDGAGYEYDPVGQQVAEISAFKPDKKNVFLYDEAGRLVKVQYEVNESNPKASRTFTFQLDGVGNRISQTANGRKSLFNHDASGQYRPDSLNRYTDIQGRKREHDAAGNLTFDDRFRYLYDHKNQLVELQRHDSNKTVASYGYDALGRRVFKKTSSGTVTYLYDGFQVIAEYNGDGTLKARYIYGEGIDEILQMGCQGQTYMFHRDIQGNVTSLTDASGKVIETYSYDPFGTVTIRDSNGNVRSKSTVGNPYFFHSRRWDEESGLYYYRFRMYDPVYGRFLQRDPEGYAGGGLGLYEAFASNPISFTDPMGLSPRKRKSKGFWDWVFRLPFFGYGSNYDKAMAQAEVAADRLVKRGAKKWGCSCEESRDRLKTWGEGIKLFANTTLEMTPGTGGIVAVGMTVTGKNLNGDKVSATERVLSGVGVLLTVKPAVRGGYKHLKSGRKWKKTWAYQTNMKKIPWGKEPPMVFGLRDEGKYFQKAMGGITDPGWNKEYIWSFPKYKHYLGDLSEAVQRGGFEQGRMFCFTLEGIDLKRVRLVNPMGKYKGNITGLELKALLNDPKWASKVVLFKRYKPLPPCAKEMINNYINSMYPVTREIVEEARKHLLK